MNLIIPVNHHNKRYLSCEILKPKGGVIADAVEELSKTGEFGGMSKLIIGCTTNFVDEKGEIAPKTETESIVRNMPIHTAEYLALKVLSSINNEGVEQIAICPRCKKEHVYEDDEAIKFEDLEYVMCENPDPFTIKLEEPVQIKAKNGDILLSVKEFTMRFPTVNDGISGSIKYSGNRDIRRQYAIYASAIQTVNGDEVDMKFKTQWGVFMFERMVISDIEQISAILKQYGIKKHIKRDCSCGKSWYQPLDLSGFFVSGLQLG